MRRTDRRRGFTLLEVMVALLLLALALVALIRMAGLEARALQQQQDATLAQWVAANRLAEVRLNRQLPTGGRAEGQTRMGARDWRWQLDAAATDEPSLVRLDVRVFLDGDRSGDPAASLTGFYRQ